MFSKKASRQTRSLKAAPPHPNYEDEISEKQIQVIREIADPDGKRASKRVVLYPSLV